MKKITLLLVSSIISILVISQTPQAFKYQAVVRNDLGEVINSETVSFRISIHDSISAGPVQYQETHIVLTDAYGHANLEIGTGEVTIGVFTDIDWNDDDKFLEVELDLEGGDAYFVMGTTQLLAVPYSLYAETTGDTTRWRKNSDDLYYLDGKIGIGTISPAYNLDIYSNSTTASRLRLSNLDYSKTLFFSSGSESFDPSIYFQGGDALRFMRYDGGYQELMRIQGDGDIGIGTIAPNESAILELNSNSKGFLPSRLTNHERDAMSNPVAGLFIFNLDEGIFQFFDGANWQSMYMAPCLPSQPDTIFGETYPGCNQTGMIYSIDEISGATNYNWTVPSDASIISGMGTLSIVVDFGILSGNIRVRAENGCGNSAFNNLFINIGIPSMPGIISGDTILDCNETGVVYTIDSIPGASNYNWTVPVDATITSGQNTPSIIVDFGTQNGNVTVFTENGCGNSSSRVLAVTVEIPAIPDYIAGNNHPACNETGVVYSIDSVAGATNYTWTVPSGATITSGQGTTEITVDFGTTGGDVKVRAENSCGNSNFNVLAVIIDIPAQPGFISGDSNPNCYEEDVPYSIALVPGATNYLWTVPTSAIIQTGQGTANIKIDFDDNSGNVSVRAENSCGNSLYRDKSVTFTIPPIPSYIQGPSEVCPYSTEIYYIDHVSGATNYNWTVPPGATFINNGNFCTVEFKGQTGLISVSACNNCGCSSAIDIYVAPPVSPIGCYFEGGLLFYKEDPEPGYLDTTWLVCAATDQIGAYWGCFGTDISNAVWYDILYGDTNTYYILQECGQNSIAARVCDELILNGYDDWFLPSVEELELMHFNLHLNGIGDFTVGGSINYPEYYWSSTQDGGLNAKCLNFYNGNYTGDQKFNRHHVRAIRKIVWGQNYP